MNELLTDLSAEDRAFQQEVREFLAASLTPEMRDAARYSMWVISEFEYGRQWQKILHQRGWGVAAWPEEYGGTGWSPTQMLIWNVECLDAGAPTVMSMGRDLCAPCIMEFGTEEQKAFFLPRIASGDDWWAQGFSEPGVGSDLGALQMRAERDGDEFVLNGSKIWTSFAQYGNRIFCPVRTGSGPRKQDGISFLLIDLDSPGIEVRPITTIAGDDEFCQVFFSDVRVPRSRLLGEENEGWAVVRYMLTYEHGGSRLSSRSATLTERFHWLLDLAAIEPDGHGHTLLEDVDFSRHLAEVAIEIEAAAFAETELNALAKSGKPPSSVHELLTIRSREVAQRISELAMRAIGPKGLPSQKAARTVASGVPAIGPEHAVTPMPFYLAQRARTIAGGTTEIHHNNVAKRLLGL